MSRLKVPEWYDKYLKYRFLKQIIDNKVEYDSVVDFLNKANNFDSQYADLSMKDFDIFKLKEHHMDQRKVCKIFLKVLKVEMQIIYHFYEIKKTRIYSKLLHYINLYLKYQIISNRQKYEDPLNGLITNKYEVDIANNKIYDIIQWKNNNIINDASEERIVLNSQADKQRILKSQSVFLGDLELAKVEHLEKKKRINQLNGQSIEKIRYKGLEDKKNQEREKNNYANLIDKEENENNNEVIINQLNPLNDSTNSVDIGKNFDSLNSTNKLKNRLENNKKPNKNIPKRPQSLSHRESITPVKFDRLNSDTEFKDLNEVEDYLEQQEKNSQIKELLSNNDSKVESIKDVKLKNKTGMHVVNSLPKGKQTHDHIDYNKINKNLQEQEVQSVHFNDEMIYKLFDYISRATYVNALTQYQDETTQFFTNVDFMNSYERLFLESYREILYFETFIYTNTMAFKKITKKFVKNMNKFADLEELENIKSDFDVQPILEEKELRLKLKDNYFFEFMKINFYNNSREETRENIKLLVKPVNQYGYQILYFTNGIVASLVVIFILFIVIYKSVFLTFLTEDQQSRYDLFSIIILYFPLAQLLVQSQWLIHTLDNFEINWRTIMNVNASNDDVNPLYVTWASTLIMCNVIVIMLVMTFYQFDYFSEDIKVFFYIQYILPFFVILLPFNFLSYRFRTYLLKNLCYLFATPYYPVKFYDAMFADVMCSLTKLFQIIIYTGIVTYEWNFTGDSIVTGQGYKYFSSILAFPYYIRMMQTLRCYYDTRNYANLLNTLKYMLSIGYVLIQLVEFEYKREIVIGFGVCVSLYSFLWDILMDFKLWVYSAHSENGSEYVFRQGKFSRRMMVRTAVLDLVLRFTWIYNLQVGSFIQFEILGFINSNMLINLLLIMLEIYRRFLWLLIRIEVENIQYENQSLTSYEVPYIMLY